MNQARLIIRVKDWWVESQLCPKQEKKRFLEMWDWEQWEEGLGFGGAQRGDG